MTESGPDLPPRRRRKDARPGEIIDAGLKEFALNGLAATRLEDVAKRAGIAKGTIYRYFSSKEDLFVAAIRSRIVLSIEGVDAAVERFEGPTDELLKLVLGRIYSEFVGTDTSALMRILIAEGNRFPDLIKLYHSEAISKGMSMLKSIVDRGVSRGEFRDGPAITEPRIIIAPAIMAAIWQATFQSHDPLPIDRFIDAHIDTLLNGLLENDQ
ncbi:MAG: TetR/AcrR family transcriptional regulator [Hyphomicrobiales bacterium]|uniref:TetR/AcrR family transcriptional regulator n=1 Tax=Nisaea sp. TaxID=2024842 RepID=UPI00326EC730